MRNFKKNIFFLPFFCISSILFTHAQNFPNLHFVSITEKDGLSNNEMGKLIQDDKGLMWFGTSNGLNIYDGLHIKKIYSNTKDSNTLQNNTVAEISKDEEGNMWVINPGGCAKVDKYTLQFTNFNLPTYGLIHHKNKTLIFSSEGVYEYTNNKFTKNNNWVFKPITSYGRTDIQYGNIIKDKLGNYWASNTEVIYKINNGDPKKVDTFYKKDFHSTIVTVDDDNNVWVGTWGIGLYKLDIATKKFISIPLDVKNAICLDAKIWTYNDINYLVICNSYGITLLNTATLKAKTYTIQKSTKPDELVQAYHIFVDAKNNLWISTSEGVRIVSPYNNLFEVMPVFKEIKNDKNYSSNGNVYNFVELPSGYWLSKRYTAGTFWYNKNWGLQHFWSKSVATNTDFYHNDLYQYETYDFIQKGNTVYYTTEGAISKFDIGTKKTVHIYTKDSSVPKLRNIIELNDSSWLIRSFDRGAFIFNPLKNVFTKHIITYEKNGSKILQFHYFVKTKKGQVIASTEYGLYYYDGPKNTFLPLAISNLPNKNFEGMAVDKNNILWAGSVTGLYAIDIENKKLAKDFSQYNEMGLVTRIAVDSSNNIWFNCAKGYWCWQQSKNKMVQFGYELGLPANNDVTAFTTLSNGTIVAGAYNSIVKFNPVSNITDKTLIEKCIISEIQVNDTEVNSTYINDSTASITVKPNQNNINILYGITDYTFKNNYAYYYKLNNNSEWAKTTNGQITLNSLEHGDYNIQVMGINNITDAKTGKYTLQVTIQPKWHQTWWFNLLVLLATTGLIYAFIKFRATQIKQTEKLKVEYENKMLQLEMQNLRSQMNPHFIFNSLNSINSFIVENKTHLASDYLTKFSRLIRLILENSKNENITLEKEIETLKLYLLMEGIRFNNKFGYTINVAHNIDEQTKIPSMIIQPYIENAIWHGLLHKQEKGNVQIDITNQNGALKIIVADNGIGREKAAKLKSKNSTSTKSYGMQITAQRIMQSNPKNKIEVIDEEDENKNPVGTKVILTINT